MIGVFALSTTRVMQFAACGTEKKQLGFLSLLKPKGEIMLEAL